MYPVTGKNYQDRGGTSLKDSIESKSQEYEAEIIWETLQKRGFSRSKAAKELGVSRTTLWRKLKNIESARSKK